MVGTYLTSVELEQRGISRKLAYDWFDVLEVAEFARRAPGRVWGTKLFSPEAVEFLRTRKGKVGAPKAGWSRASCFEAWKERRELCLEQ